MERATLQALQETRVRLKALNKPAKDRSAGQLADVDSPEYALKAGNAWERTYTLYDLTPKFMIP